MTANRLERLQQKLFSKAEAGQLERPDDFIKIHHILMKEYGWIPIEEFKNLPIPALWGLLDCIKKQHEMEKKEMDKIKHKGKR